MMMKQTVLLSCVSLLVLDGSYAFVPASRQSLERRRCFHSSQSSLIKGAVSIQQQQQPVLSSLHVSTLVDEVETSTTASEKTTDVIEPNNEIVVVDSEVVIENEQQVAIGSNDNDLSDEEYKKGFAIIGLITLFNASLAPVWHVVFEGNGPPPLFLNAVVSVIALIGLLAGGPFLDKSVDSMSSLADNDEQKWSPKSFRGGMELGFWKGLGTTCHIYGLALTTANHGAFFLQLTTLIVPVIQGLRGEKIPRQIQLAVALALAGIYAFTQDPTAAGDVDSSKVLMGDALCVGAAVFYSVYDIQTFFWGREVPRTELVTIKIGFQAILSCLLCAATARGDVMEYINSGPEWSVFIPAALWSGLIVNALATFLQVGGMQAVGPTRAQTIFASQPLWASIANYVFIGEMMGPQGFVGGGAFLGALVLAATAEAPKPTTTTPTEAEQAA